MGTAISLRNVISEAVDIFLISFGPLQGNFNSHVVLGSKGMNDRFVNRCSFAIQVLYEGANAPFVFESICLICTLISENYSEHRD